MLPPDDPAHWPRYPPVRKSSNLFPALIVLLGRPNLFDQAKKVSKPASMQPPKSMDQSPISKPRSRPSAVIRVNMVATELSTPVVPSEFV